MVLKEKSAFLDRILRYFVSGMVFWAWEARCLCVVAQFCVFFDCARAVSHLEVLLKC